jgi:hypothetical protein
VETLTYSSGRASGCDSPGLLNLRHEQNGVPQSGCSVLRNYTADEGRPLEPACRSRTQTTFRCCFPKGSGGERRRKRPGKLGQVTSRERNESEPLPCRKQSDDVETMVVRRSWDKAPAGPAYGRSGIRHTGGLNLEEAVVWNMRTLASMQTEKPQVD